MTDHTTRRGFLGMSGRAAAGAAVAAALPVICSGPAHAADPTHATGPAAELPVVTGPDHPAARIPRVSAADRADGVSREPLNAAAECGLPTGTARAGGAVGGRF
ncbi:twin-arginine translocation signal domain-containing protein [Streptomyces poriticola]|uniref:twin-arginine translocation signal domain-containing protein n=1 Tax=Streptomyces poriticola TaxID=3120506 RepID=UPI002FCE3A96